MADAIVPRPPAPVDEARDQNEVAGAGGVVTVCGVDGRPGRRVTAFAPAEAPGGVQAVLADVTCDGAADLVAAGAGGGPRVAVYHG